MEDALSVSIQLEAGKIDENFVFGPKALLQDSERLVEQAKEIIGRRRYQDIVARQERICDKRNAAVANQTVRAA